MGLAAVEKLRAKQTSRLRHIKAAEANAKLFYLYANGRRRKNTIHSLATAAGMCYSHEDKESALFQHFSNHFGPPGARECTLNWDELGITRHDLSFLEEMFTEDEVLTVVKEIAGDRAPGPDGFIGVFLKSSWGMIKHDVMLAVHSFYHLHDQHFKQLNTAHLILLAKKSDAQCIGDYRPISLTHSIAKLFSKILATRLVGTE